MYRVVQESLTNIRKHAGPSVTAVVSLAYGYQGLVIRVTDDGRGASASDGASSLTSAPSWCAGSRCPPT